MRTVVFDIEADNLLPKVSKIWCIVAKDIHTKEVFKFYPDSPLSGHQDFKEAFLKFAQEVETWIGHNIVSYDIKVLKLLLGLEIRISQCVDTLILSRLFRPVAPFEGQPFKGYDRRYGHSLDAWGRFLNVPKYEFNDWSKFSMEQLTYCVQDVEVGEAVYKHLMSVEAEGFSELSIRLEHKVADILSDQELAGFTLDIEKARSLHESTASLLADMDAQLQELFPPKLLFEKNWTPLIKKDGTMGSVSQRILEAYGDLAVPQEDGSFNLHRLETFNPQSSKQIASRLQDIGWKPRKFTDKGAPKTDKETLKEAINELSDYPAVSALASYNIVADRHQKAGKWLELVAEDGRVHGRVNPIGAGTHRCSHYDDNMANIARVTTTKRPTASLGVPLKELKPFTSLPDGTVFIHGDEETSEVALTGLKGAFGWECRSCWIPKKGWIQVGSDASGIQLRALAHYMNDPVYTKHLLEGDIHEVNRVAAGISTRPIAKTFIYAWLLGAGDEKIGSIVGVDPKEYGMLFDWVGGERGVKNVIAKLHREKRSGTKKLVYQIIKGAFVKKKFLDSIPALKRLKEEDIPRATKQGYLLGLDGRKLWIPSQHLAMSLYLQGFEAVVMKFAICAYQQELKKQGIPFQQMAFVHDEVQVETPHEYADVVGQAFVNAVEKAGEVFQSNCPLTGEYKIGYSWAQCH